MFSTLLQISLIVLLLVVKLVIGPQSPSKVWPGAPQVSRNADVQPPPGPAQPKFPISCNGWSVYAVVQYELRLSCPPGWLLTDNLTGPVLDTTAPVYVLDLLIKSQRSAESIYILVSLYNKPSNVASLKAWVSQQAPGFDSTASGSVDSALARWRMKKIGFVSQRVYDGGVETVELGTVAGNGSVFSYATYKTAANLKFIYAFELQLPYTAKAYGSEYASIYRSVIQRSRLGR